MATPSPQRSLFDAEPAPWELDEQSEQMVAEIVFSAAPWGPFDYAVPDALRASLALGKRVRVPLGRGDRQINGYCVKLENRLVGARQLKPIAQVIDEQSLLSPHMLRLTEWMADYYLCHWGQALDAVVPAGVRFQAGTRQTLFFRLAPHVIAQQAELKLSPKQQAIVAALAKSSRALTLPQLMKLADVTAAPIQALRKRQILLADTERVMHAEVDEVPLERESHHELHAEQVHALKAILDTFSAGHHRTILIHGVTGSGKTEVYIRAIEEAIRFGRQAIVLVPEISLTPQTRHRFRSRFERVAVLHSHLSDSERHWHWQRIARGEVEVIVGARSAIFAPAPHLGLVIIDEEHDGSFKQDSAPRYHAREVAEFRARSEGIPLVLGSATPSLESYRRAQLGQYQQVDMPTRVYARPLPHVAAIDLRTEFQNRSSRGAVSRQLHQAIDQSLREDGQVILLLNRRGFATSIQCPACGHVVECPHCSISLTHHRVEEKAVCHYCDYLIAAPTQCPECKFDGIRYAGFGTQKLEAEIRSRFPNVPILRMDSDTMQKPGSHEVALTRFREGEVKILLGTQMIAKGLDFPNVTLVGVINADTALHFPDFRASETTFQLVTQVAGRTGRGEKGGRVLVQTFSPEHPAIQAAMQHDYVGFATGELLVREKFNYPPAASLVRLIIRGEIESVAESFAEQLAARVHAAIEKRQVEARVLGPAPAPIAKLHGKHRFHIMMQGHDGAALRQVVRDAAVDLKPPEETLWAVDVDPLDLL
jgi:primosomal protein N' (replication factor Y) (superfamily II helicase)